MPEPTTSNTIVRDEAPASVPSLPRQILLVGGIFGKGFAVALDTVLSEADEVAASDYAVHDGGVAAVICRHLGHVNIASYHPANCTGTLDDTAAVINALRSLREELLSAHLTRRRDVGLFALQEEQLSVSELREHAKRIYRHEIAACRCQGSFAMAKAMEKMGGATNLPISQLRYLEFTQNCGHRE